MLLKKKSIRCKKKTVKGGVDVPNNLKNENDWWILSGLCGPITTSQLEHTKQNQVH